MSIVLVTGVPNVGKTTYLANKPAFNRISFDDWLCNHFHVGLVVAYQRFAENKAEVQQLWYDHIKTTHRKIREQQLYVEDCLVTVRDRLDFYNALAPVPYAVLWLQPKSIDVVKDRIIDGCSNGPANWLSARIEMLIRAEPPTTFEQERYPVFTLVL